MMVWYIRRTKRSGLQGGRVQRSWEDDRLTDTLIKMAIELRFRNARERKPLKFSSIESEEDSKVPLVQSDGSGVGIDLDSSTDSKMWLRVKATQRPRSNSDFGPASALVYQQLIFPVVIKNCFDLQQRLDLMQERCIARNLRTAGLGGIAEDDEAAISKLLDPNARMATGETMLIGIVLHVKDPEVQPRYTSILLSEGADVNATDEKGKTVLMYACDGGLERVVKVLLQHDACDLLFRDNDGNTGLMYAAAHGSVKILKLYLKSLRRYDKIAYGQQKQAVHETCTGQIDPVGNFNIDSPHVTEKSGKRSSSFAMEDPLEMQNVQGNTARALALKHGHLECADLLNEERLRRIKERKKRLHIISHQRINESAMSRSATKKSIQRFMLHSTSFDSIYIENGDHSDDDLIRVPLKGGKGNQRKSQIENPTNELTEKIDNSQKNQPNGKESMKKRFQSYPDLFRLRQSGSLDILEDQENELEEECPLSPTEVNYEEEERDEVSGMIKRRQTLQENVNTRIGLVQQPRKFSTYPNTGECTKTQPNKEITTGRTGKNITERVINFFRRPKYYTDVELLNGGEDRSTYGTINISRDQSIDQDEKGELPRHLKKNHSQPDVNDKNLPTVLYPSAGVQVGMRKHEEMLKMKRRSMDANFMSSFRRGITGESSGMGQMKLAHLHGKKATGACHLPPLQHSQAIVSQQGREKSTGQYPIDSDSGLSSRNSSAAGTSSRPLSADSASSQPTVTSFGRR